MDRGEQIRGGDQIYRDKDTFTDTATEISNMEIALCLQSVAVVDRQATFTDTSTRTSSMEIAPGAMQTNVPRARHGQGVKYPN